jgi:hypothetical protein
MNTAVLLTTLTVVILFVNVNSQNPACAAASNCSTCGTNSGCVWCSSSSSCLDYTYPNTTCAQSGWYTYPQCDSCPSKVIINNGWGVISAIPQPTVSITYNAGYFNFAVNASYLTEDFTWTIDFESWNGNTRSINNPNNCENRLASTFSGLTWSEYWNAATFATLPEALNNVQLPPYGPSNWTLYADSCSAVTYSRSFSFSNLVSCRGSTGSQLVSVQQVNGSNLIQYSGSLYVTAVGAVDPNNSTAGYVTYEYAYPFQFGVVTYVNSMTTASQEGSVYVASVQSMKLVSGKLNIVIDTALSSPAGMSNYVTSPVILSTPVACSIVQGPNILTPNVPCTNLNTQGQCLQTYTLTSNNVEASYGGQYTIQWAVVNCTIATGVCVNSTRVVNGTLIIDNTAVGPTQIDTTLSTTLTLYNANFGTQMNGPFYAGDTVVVKDQLNVAPTDVNQFSLNINNAWVCYSIVPGQVPKYDPMNGLFGCSQPYGGYVVSSSIVQIVNNGVPTNSTATQRLFATQIMAPLSQSNLNYTSTTALSFAATPITSQNANYYIQIESIVGTVSRRSIAQPQVRRVMMNSIVSGLSEAAYIIVTPQSTQTAKSDTAGIELSFAAILLAFIVQLL